MIFEALLSLVDWIFLRGVKRLVGVVFFTGKASLPFWTHGFSNVQFFLRFWEIRQILIFQLPKIRPIANLLSSKLPWWKLENPKASQLPKILPITIKSANSHFNHQSRKII